MSREAPVGLTFMEKLMGILMIIVGAHWFYTTYTNMGSLPVPTLLLGGALALIILGIVLLIAKFG